LFSEEKLGSSNTAHGLQGRRIVTTWANRSLIDASYRCASRR
jgi:hypothetical protein